LIYFFRKLAALRAAEQEQYRAQRTQFKAAMQQINGFECAADIIEDKLGIPAAQHVA
jgi:hypothetical protein